MSFFDNINYVVIVDMFKLVFKRWNDKDIFSWVSYKDHHRADGQSACCQLLANNQQPSWRNPHKQQKWCCLNSKSHQLQHTRLQRCLPVQHILDSTIRCEVTRTADELSNCCGRSHCSRHRPACRQFHCPGHTPDTQSQPPVHNTTCLLHSVHSRVIKLQSVLLQLWLRY